MIFTETSLPGAYVIDLERRGDDRGFFARTFCTEELAEYGLASDVSQANVSVTRNEGTIRGMHYQVGASAEDKIIRCVRGRILDVFIDIRPDSPTFARHEKVELDAATMRQVYVPKGFAHGFLTLTDDCEVTYNVTHAYAPEDERGIRWNDPRFGIDWGIEDPILSPKDAALPDWTG
jgi:dTDP-4-dehydrorhamnose 3,5-epimerase